MLHIRSRYYPTPRIQTNLHKQIRRPHRPVFNVPRRAGLRKGSIVDDDLCALPKRRDEHSKDLQAVFIREAVEDYAEEVGGCDDGLWGEEAVGGELDSGLEVGGAHAGGVLDYEGEAWARAKEM